MQQLLHDPEILLLLGGRAARLLLDLREDHLELFGFGLREHPAHAVDLRLLFVGESGQRRVFGGSRAFGLEATEAQWHEALTLNFTRHRQLTQRLLPQMVAGRWGRIVNITGKSEPEGINGAFCAKAALTAWSKGLSREVGQHGITVNCIPPGRIMSDQIRRNYTPEYREWQSKHEIPMGRYGEPEELADVAVFLASPRAGYITGAVYPVDGGLRRYQY